MDADVRESPASAGGYGRGYGRGSAGYSSTSYGMCRYSVYFL